MPRQPKACKFFVTGLKPEHEVKLLLADLGGVIECHHGLTGLVISGPANLKLNIIHCLGVGVKSSKLGDMTHLMIRSTSSQDFAKQLAGLRQLQQDLMPTGSPCKVISKTLPATLAKAFAAMAEKIIGPAVAKPLVLTGPYYGESAAKPSPANFTILLDVQPPGDQPSNVDGRDFDDYYEEEFPDRLWGVSTECLNERFNDGNCKFATSTTAGWPIYPPESMRHSVAQLIDNRALYINIPLGCSTEHRAEQVAIFHHILHEAANFLLADITAATTKKAAAVKPKQQTDRDRYITLCGNRLEKIDHAIDHGLVISQLLVSQLQRDLTAAVALQQRIQEKSAAANVSPLGLEYDRLLAVEHVQRVEVRSRGIHVFTDTLYCTDPRDNVVHEIGKFRIELSLDGYDSCVRWFNLERQVNGFQAPHVKSTGNACLGNMKDLLPQLIGKREFAVATTMAIAFVESVNVNDGWGKHIDLWPVAEGKKKKK